MPTCKKPVGEGASLTLISLNFTSALDINLYFQLNIFLRKEKSRGTTIFVYTSCSLPRLLEADSSNLDKYQYAPCPLEKLKEQIGEGSTL